ncbi:MAG: GntR family transcriptional regulator [Candidatus Humimicrobiaceae bacterium]
MVSEDKKSVEKNTPVHYYYQLELLFKEKIESGQWLTDSFIPSERDLCEEFNVSRITVRKAVENLESYGLLKRIKNKGTVVGKKQKNNSLLSQAFSFYDYLTQRGFSVKNEVLKFNKKLPSPHIQNFLQLKNKDEIFEIQRLRSINNEPWYFTMIYLPVELFGSIREEDLVSGSIHEVFKSKFRLRAEKTKRYLYAGVSDDECSELLKIDKGSPVQIIENINYSESNMPFEYAINYFRQDKIIIEAVLYRDTNLLSIKEKET